MILERIDFLENIKSLEKKEYCLSEKLGIYFQIQKIFYDENKSHAYCEISILSSELKRNSTTDNFEKSINEVIIKKFKKLINTSFEEYLRNKFDGAIKFTSTLWLEDGQNFILYKEISHLL
ncbi:MAG: hypothetical protein MRY57_00205 [Candidatus Pacebacteria bacterium]|nr:hypothetical protein [Candidatus Paceibacterota bacterium]